MEDVNFWIIQVIGLLAWILLVISYYRKTTNKILIFQMIATLLYCLHYFLLDAYAGMFICIFEIIRDYGYYKTDKDDYIFLSSIPIYVLMAVFSFKSFIDLLPIFSSTVDGYTLTQDKKTIVFGAVISHSCWLIYDLGVKSYSGTITSGILILSNLLILFFDKDLFRGKDIRKI